ncbi:MAG TPA: bifunctional 5,10-methylenetetrahydrofolate dehydrogenase/5,10-methenyltetrahydrofolate cyclohydrolase [Candidatus Saccharimonadales bacterium]|nr:bifunctional 5,10-methylenetetrahydrofolate dehydrogenase/5,10-methenyltetrahydrofolate cyclohydrolase [Candidatus Saccharimonadales bacterium]
MRLLSGSDLASFIKERQAKQVRGLKQAEGIVPKLAVVLTDDNPVSRKYISLKQRYGEDIGIELVLEETTSTEAVKTIKRLNGDPSVFGIIVQLPISDPSLTEEVVKAISPEKDVDGLGSTKFFDPATPVAILWLLAGYNISLTDKKVLLIGQGQLVGRPLKKMLENSGITPEVADIDSDVGAMVAKAEVIVTATGQPGLLKSEMIPKGCVVVDAGTTSEGGKLVGDLDPAVYETRDDLTLTPRIGGVGPLTVCALFDNVIRSARRMAESKRK